MRILVKLSEKIEECKRHLFNNGYTYDESSDFVQLVFEETGMGSIGVFDQIEKSVIEDTISHLNKIILK